MKFFLIWLIFSMIGCAQPENFFITKAPNQIDFSQLIPFSVQSVNDITTVLSDAIAKANQAPETQYEFIFRSARYRCTETMTVPKNVIIVFQPGAMISVTSNKTLTIKGGIRADKTQIFDCSTAYTTGNVIFGTGSTVSEVYPEWWGAKADCNMALASAASNGINGTDNYASIQKAVNSLAPELGGIGGTVRLSAGVYRNSRTINGLQYVSIKGAGQDVTYLFRSKKDYTVGYPFALYFGKWYGGIPYQETQHQFSVVEDFSVQSDWVAADGALTLNGAYTIGHVGGDVIFNRLSLRYISSEMIQIWGSYSSHGWYGNITIKDCLFEYGGMGAISLNSPYMGANIRNCTFRFVKGPNIEVCPPQFNYNISVRPGNTVIDGNTFVGATGITAPSTGFWYEGCAVYVHRILSTLSDEKTMGEVSITNNFIDSCDYFGIWINECMNVLVQGNYITRCQFGIAVTVNQHPDVVTNQGQVRNIKILDNTIMYGYHASTTGITYGIYIGGYGSEPHGSPMHVMFQDITISGNAIGNGYYRVGDATGVSNGHRSAMVYGIYSNIGYYSWKADASGAAFIISDNVLTNLVTTAISGSFPNGTQIKGNTIRMYAYSTYAYPALELTGVYNVQTTNGGSVRNCLLYVIDNKFIDVWADGTQYSFAKINTDCVFKGNMWTTSTISYESGRVGALTNRLMFRGFSDVLFQDNINIRPWDYAAFLTGQLGGTVTFFSGYISTGDGYYNWTGASTRYADVPTNRFPGVWRTGDILSNRGWTTGTSEIPQVESWYVDGVDGSFYSYYDGKITAFQILDGGATSDTLYIPAGTGFFKTGSEMTMYYNSTSVQRKVTNELQIATRYLIPNVVSSNYTTNIASDSLVYVHPTFIPRTYATLEGTSGVRTDVITAGTALTFTITVTGAATSNYVEVSPSTTIGLLSCYAYVSSANTVTVVVNNGTAGSITLGSVTFKVMVKK